MISQNEHKDTRAGTDPSATVSDTEDIQNLEPLVSNFQRNLMGDDATSRQDSIEGLAYASLKPQIKFQLTRDLDFLKRMVKVMSSDKPRSTWFGGLTVFKNITAYLPLQTEEQQKMSELKAYANTSKPAKIDPLDKDDAVTRRCKKVLAADIVVLLVLCSKQATPATMQLIAEIMLSLAKEQKHRGTMAQQGAVKCLFQISSSHALPESARPAAHALARILISTNPDHVFGSSNLPLTSAVRPLGSLLNGKRKPR